MPEKMLFGSIIDEQGVPFTADLQDADAGEYVDGDWVAATPSNKEYVGVILPLVMGSSNVGETLTYAENGVYSLKDRKLLTIAYLPAGTLVEYKGIKYTVQDFKDYSDYTDVNTYLLRWREK